MYDGFNFGGTTTNHQTTNFNSMTTLHAIWYDIMKDYTILVYRMCIKASHLG